MLSSSGEKSSHMLNNSNYHHHQTQHLHASHSQSPHHHNSHNPYRNRGSTPPSPVHNHQGGYSQHQHPAMFGHPHHHYNGQNDTSNNVGNFKAGNGEPLNSEDSHVEMLARSSGVGRGGYGTNGSPNHISQSMSHSSFNGPSSSFHGNNGPFQGMSRGGASTSAYGQSFGGGGNFNGLHPHSSMPYYGESQGRPHSQGVHHQYGHPPSGGFNPSSMGYGAPTYFSPDSHEKSSEDIINHSTNDNNNDNNPSNKSGYSNSSSRIDSSTERSKNNHNYTQNNKTNPNDNKQSPSTSSTPTSKKVTKPTPSPSASRSNHKISLDPDISSSSTKSTFNQNDHNSSPMFTKKEDGMSTTSSTPSSSQPRAKSLSPEDISEQIDALAAKVSPMRSDFHFYALESKEKHMDEAKQMVRRHMHLLGPDSQKDEDQQKLMEDPFLIMTALNELILKSWENEPLQLRNAYLVKEEEDRKRFMTEDEIASRHCATLTARAKAPKLSGNIKSNGNGSPDGIYVRSVVTKEDEEYGGTTLTMDNNEQQQEERSYNNRDSGDDSIEKSRSTSTSAGTGTGTERKRVNSASSSPTNSENLKNDMENEGQVSQDVADNDEDNDQTEKESSFKKAKVDRGKEYVV